MRIGKISSSTEYRMDDQLQNWQFLESNLGFSNWKNLENCQFSYLDNSQNSENFQFGKFK